ncbi:MAG: hypothetical protein ACLUQ6_03760 [Alistipes onderdonkii]
MWYCATLARDLGYELDDVAQMNVDKLRSRMQRHIISGSGDRPLRTWKIISYGRSTGSGS